MSILLQSLNMPKGNPITINIYRDGSWVDAYTTKDGRCIEVPTPHGGLIDGNGICKRVNEANYLSDSFKFIFTMIVASEEDIIEAEGGKT